MRSRRLHPAGRGKARSGEPPVRPVPENVGERVEPVREMGETCVADRDDDASVPGFLGARHRETGEAAEDGGFRIRQAALGELPLPFEEIRGGVVGRPVESPQSLQERQKRLPRGVKGGESLPGGRRPRRSPGEEIDEVRPNFVSRLRKEEPARRKKRLRDRGTRPVPPARAPSRRPAPGRASRRRSRRRAPPSRARHEPRRGSGCEGRATLRRRPRGGARRGRDPR